MKKKHILKANIRALSLSLLIGLQSVISFAALTPPSGDKISLQEQLFQKIQVGKLENVKSLLRAGANVHDTNSVGLTPLHYAVLFNHLDIANYLTDVGALVDAQNERDGDTPLHYAIDKEHVGMVKLLINRSADIFSANHHKHTPLHMAREKGNMMIIEALFKAHTVQLTESEGQQECTSVHPKGEKIKKTGVRFLKEEKQAKKQRASKKAQKKVLSQQHGYDIQLLEAAANGASQEVVALLFVGANIGAKNQSGYTPLHFAAVLGHIDVVRLLLENHANTEVGAKTIGTPLHVAGYTGHTEVIKLLLKHRADPEAGTKTIGTPLHVAVSAGRADIVRLLLEKGANPKAVDGAGRTPLYYAGVHDRTKIVSLLLEKIAQSTLGVKAAKRRYSWPQRMAIKK